MPVSTVTEYLDALPADRREALNQVRRGINRALPAGYKKGIQWGMISWFVPRSTYPPGCGGNKKVPVSLISVASQKSLHKTHRQETRMLKAFECEAGWPMARPDAHALELVGRCDCRSETGHGKFAPCQHPP